MRSDLERRRRELSTYLRQTAINAREMADQLDAASTSVMWQDENANEPFADAMLIITNFMMNLRLSQAVKLASRYATQETHDMGL